MAIDTLGTRECPVHGHLDMSKWTERLRDIDLGDVCPVINPRYEEPCGERLGPVCEWVRREALTKAQIARDVYLSKWEGSS